MSGKTRPISRSTSGLPHNLELDLDAPYLTIQRTAGNQPSSGMGDTNMGIKWAFHKESKGSRLPALVPVSTPNSPPETPSSNSARDWPTIGSISSRKSPLSEKTRITGNLGILFAGNTSTGVLGIQNTRGQVYTGGLSMLHDFSSRLTLGAELYGGYAEKDNLGKSNFRPWVAVNTPFAMDCQFCFGLLGGKYVASPQIGGQIGFAVDFPALWVSASRHDSAP